MSERLQCGETDRLWATAFDANGAAVTGASVSFALKRKSDGRWWNGATFQVAATSNLGTEADSTNLPGFYYYDFTVPASSDDSVIIRATSSTPGVVTDPWTEELKIGGYWDDLSSSSSNVSTIMATLDDSILPLLNYLRPSFLRLEELVRGLYTKIEIFSDRMDKVTRSILDALKSIANLIRRG